MKIKIFDREISISREDTLKFEIKKINEDEEMFHEQVLNEIEEEKNSDRPSLWLTPDDYDLEVVPSMVWEFTQLKELTIQCGKNLRIPSNISKLANLEKISFTCHNYDDYKINTKIVVAEEFKLLKSLKTIEFHGEGIEHIPEQLFSPKNIECVEIWDAKINEIPKSIFKINSLKELTIVNSDILTIPNSISHLLQLEYLNLSELKISILPQEIGKLHYLSILNLANNHLKNLPKSFKNLDKLEQLDLSNNEFSKFPKECLYSPILRALDIDGNSFADTPEVLNMGIHELKKHFQLSTNFKLNIPKTLTTAFQQYLLFFREYMSSAKGINAKYDVFVREDSLEISIEFNQFLDENLFSQYLEEYLNFAKENTIGIINVEGEKNPNQIDLLRLNLDLQVSNLTNQINMKNWQIKFLENELNEKKSDFNKILELISNDISNKKNNRKIINHKNIFYSECIDLLKLGEIKSVFTKLFNAKSTNSNSSDEILLLSSRFEKLESQNNQGVIELKEYNQEVNKITIPLLRKLRKLELQNS